MDWILYIVAALFLILGAVCIVLVVIQLPGVWMMLALAVIIEIADGLYLAAPNDATFGWWILGACLVVASIGELVEFLASAAGAKGGGASRRGMIGSLIGGVLGGFVFAPLFSIVPVAGTLFGLFFGAILGTFVGAVVGELSAKDSSISSTMKPALGASIGRVLGTMSKVGVALVVWIVLAVVAFVPGLHV